MADELGWLRKVAQYADDFKAEYTRGSYMAAEEEARLRLFRVLGERPAPYVGPARDGIEAQRGLNDVFPGDPQP